MAKPFKKSTKKYPRNRFSFYFKKSIFYKMTKISQVGLISKYLFKFLHQIQHITLYNI